VSSLPPVSVHIAHKQRRHDAAVGKGGANAPRLSQQRRARKSGGSHTDSELKSAPGYELKAGLEFPASAPRQLVDLYRAICECDLGPDPVGTAAFLKIADPREVATVIELLAMDTEYMPRVWAKLSSLKVTEPISIDAETARLLDLFEGGYVDRKSMPVPDLLLCSLVTKCAKMRSQLRSPNKFPSVKAWKKISQLARQIAKLIHDNEMFETLFRLHDGDDATLANKRPLEYRYLTIAQTGDIMVRPGTRRLGKARRGIIELVPTLSEFFRSHFDRPWIAKLRTSSRSYPERSSTVTA